MTHVPRSYVTVMIGVAVLGAVVAWSTKFWSGQIPWAPGLLVALILFSSIWLAVCFASGHAGWNQFSERYSDSVRPAGKSFHVFLARIGSWWSGGRNVVRIKPCLNGLYFFTLPFFRAFHPPFLLPWSSLKNASFRPQGYFICRYMRVDLSNEVGPITLILREDAGEEIRRWWNAAEQRDEPDTRP